MDANTILAILGALTGIGALANSILNSRANSRNATAVTALEEGKLDLSVAVFGHDITMDLIRTLRTEVNECHEERDEMKGILQEHGLIPR